jgi:hypothetical protein
MTLIVSAFYITNFKIGHLYVIADFLNKWLKDPGGDRI